jgi:Tol biopolymer transport system component
MVEIMQRERMWIAASVAGAFLCVTASAQLTQRVSLTSSSHQSHGFSMHAAVSGDGRFVIFESGGNDLVPNDTNGALDIFVRDRRLGTTERVDVDSSGAQGNTQQDHLLGNFVSISADGRFATFESEASNLVPNDTNLRDDVFVHDRLLGTTERVSVDSNGVEGDAHSLESATSADGRFVAFMSVANNLVPNDTNVSTDIFARDRLLGTTERVSVGTGGVEGNSSSRYPTLSADGRYVAFSSEASNLVAGDTNGKGDIFVRDRQTGTTVRASVTNGGQEANAVSYTGSISGDGRFVAFSSDASNLVTGDTNGAADIFVRDLVSGTTERVSVATGGRETEGAVWFQYPSPGISADGRKVVFQSGGTDLVPGDTNGFDDVFVHDRVLGTTERVNTDSAGNEANRESLYAAISADGQVVSFQSGAVNLVAHDTNTLWDVFVHESVGGTTFTSVCEPGTNRVIGCPCGNAPSRPGRGCDNSSATGGARLSAFGGAYLSSDSLAFRTEGEKPRAMSVLTQWNALNPGGSVFGQGVHCTAGPWHVLYKRTAVGGSITVPDLAAGDLSVSERAAASGDYIHAGDSRWYIVDYRDGVVLGGCPAGSTLNSTQTGRIVWSP